MTPRLATFTVFAINGAMMGTWVAHIPWLQDHLEISKATLGLCLLCMAAGALVSTPLTGHILDGRSSASVTRVATLIFCLMLPLPLLSARRRPRRIGGRSSSPPGRVVDRHRRRACSVAGLVLLAGAPGREPLLHRVGAR